MSTITRNSRHCNFNVTFTTSWEGKLECGMTLSISIMPKTPCNMIIIKIYLTEYNITDTCASIAIPHLMSTTQDRQCVNIPQTNKVFHDMAVTVTVQISQFALHLGAMMHVRGCWMSLTCVQIDTLSREGL